MTKYEVSPHGATPEVAGPNPYPTNGRRNVPHLYASSFPPPSTNGWEAEYHRDRPWEKRRRRSAGH